ncbi:MAG TPA: NAD(P)-dependent oxidoreductase [Burkholderiales bacterium]|nr:NAD(P)-dependent oxidoreductase [Burkholderiales bacterium]
MIETIAVVGVGLMGTSLARHLLAAGYGVVVHDLDAGKVDALVAEGAKKLARPEDIAAETDIIMLSLPNSHIVNDVVRNTLKLCDGRKKATVLVDTSTPDPEMSAALAAELTEHGIEMLDATISGTSEMFAEKDAIFLVGGKEDVFDACKPIFLAASNDAFYMGAGGAGAVMKLVTNLVLTLNRMALAEGLTLARKAGLDASQALAVLKKSAAYSRAMDQKGERMVQKKFLPPASRLASSYKDARLMLALGARLDCPLPLMSFTVQAMASEICKGHQDRDPATMISFYNELAGLERSGGKSA